MSLINSFNSMTAYFQDRPEFLQLAFRGCLLMIALIIMVLFYLVISRLNYLLNRFRHRQVEDAWQETFRCLRVGEEPASFPAMSRGEKPIFLELWLETRKLATANFAQALDELARRTALDKTVTNILHPGKLEILPRKVWLQSLAITAIEYIDTEETREALKEMTEVDNLYLVVQACTCMTKKRMEGYQKKIIQALFRFPADAPEIFARVSQAGGSDVLHIMQPFLDRLPHHTIMNFISLAEGANDDSLVPMLLYRLRRASEVEEISALIRAVSRLHYRGLREAVLPFLEHPNLYVRIQAAKAMGRVGTRDDIIRLEPLLSDNDWWLRYRAARAICKLSGNDWNFLQQLINRQKDQFARDIVKHAHEELQWHSISTA